MSGGNELSVFDENKQQKRNASLIKWGYVVIFSCGVLFLSHAVMIAVDLLKPDSFLDYVRVISPLPVELIAGIVAGLSLNRGLKGGQRTWATIIEAAWVFYTGANLIVSFGAVTESTIMWIHYGFPVSALAFLSGFYMLYTSDPVHLSEVMDQTIRDKVEGIKQAAKLDVMGGEVMVTIETQKAWLDVIKKLQDSGDYTLDQIEFIVGEVPQLQPYIDKLRGQSGMAVMAKDAEPMPTARKVSGGDPSPAVLAPISDDGGDVNPTGPAS